MRNLSVIVMSLLISFTAVAQTTIKDEIKAKEESLKTEDRIKLDFFADEKSFKILDRKALVDFLQDHKQGDIYQFEILSLSDPLGLEFDKDRLKNIQGVFRQYDVNIESLTNAKIRFIASEDQKFVIIRKNLNKIKVKEKF